MKHVELYTTDSYGKVLKKEIFSITKWKEYIKKHNYGFNHFAHHYIVDRVDFNGLKYKVLLVEEKVKK